MDRLLLDACVVINLFAGGILRSLAHEAGSELIVVEQVTSEVLSVDDDDEERETLEWEPLNADRTIRPITLSRTDEVTTFLGLIPRLGDGEAASLAAARHRNLVLATDDGLALSAAAESAPSVTAVTTPDIVRWWANTVGAEAPRLAATIARIEARARYRPAGRHPLATWWADARLVDGQVRAHE
jgi:predicted nucleic acid-binding protein